MAGRNSIKLGFTTTARFAILALMPEAPDKSLESWIWDAACPIRGAKDAPKFKDYMANMNMIIHDMEGQIEIGDTFHRRRLAENAQLPDDFEKTVQQLPAAKPKRKKGGKA